MEKKVFICGKMPVLHRTSPETCTAAPGRARRHRAAAGCAVPGCSAWPLLGRWQPCSLLMLAVLLGAVLAVLVSALPGDYAGRENKQLCHPSVHTNTLPGAGCTVGKMTPKLCVMSRKRLETALAMLKIDISRGRKKKKASKGKKPSPFTRRPRRSDSGSKINKGSTEMEASHNAPALPQRALPGQEAPQHNAKLNYKNWLEYLDGGAIWKWFI